jgi:hypothetical protein
MGRNRSVAPLALAETGHSTKRPPTEAALLRLLRVKRCLLSLHPLNQIFDPVKDWLICDPRRQQTVMLDLTVQFDALFTHGSRLKVTGGKQPATCYPMTAAGLFCFKGLFCFNQMTVGSLLVSEPCSLRVSHG